MPNVASFEIHSAGFVKMNVNFFEWLRDSVRQSVLLGFSDAMDQIGSPSDSDKLNANVAALVGQTNKTKPKRSPSGQSRKRLGKSLKEMESANQGQ